MGVIDDLLSGLGGLIDIVLIVAILILVIVILKIVEKGYKVKLELRRKDRNLFYRRELEKLKNLKGNPEKVLNKVNIVARGFFKEAFDLDYHLEYLELARELRKRGRREAVSFCTLITEVSYSGEPINQGRVDILINLLEKVLRNNRILSEQDKELLKKKEQLKAAKLAKSGGKETNKQISKIVGMRKTGKGPGKSDVNKINWRYRFKIFLLRLRGRLPEIKKRKLERKEAVSKVNQEIVYKE